ncbi:Uncharacterized protein BP5553_03648 [Venustampulla echinocandica]|uniref:Protein PBN1 n=1 Tax=Venustampulla echinocandica TaxID=2656787 RepID=A0A370TV04_9HELO|nr:Uncharacterized protein BP5553_03648 [Venustampulla echinocandica]RDL39308.1 Uncharacterized protein BP5553_03648 [Venustampulla echinocandica]
MRQRITFLQKPEDSLDPRALKITTNAISTPALKAAREDRLTLGFDELPQELYRVLKATRELHIRWTSVDGYGSIPPFVSRLSPGLHVLYTPLKNSSNSLLCPTLKKVFGDLDCISPEQSFTNVSVEQLALPVTTEYHAPLSNLNDLVEYITHKLCKRKDEEECLSRVSNLQSASSLEIDFDTSSHDLTLTAFWPSRIWNLNLSKASPEQRLEVGILSVETPNEPEELSLGGFLTVIGEHTKPSPTLFSFPSRHHSTTQSFSSSFLQPTGLHPTLSLNISSSALPIEDRACSLHAHLTLPRAIFADKYQLSDPLFLNSKNLSALRYITSPVDLEAPAYAMSVWGSSLLLELSPPTQKSTSGIPWTAQIPLHLRYLLPNTNHSGLAALDVPYPVLFWACTADEGTKFSGNPFDRENLGYDGHFGKRTMFYHVAPSAGGTGNGGSLINTLDVPVLDLGKSSWVETGTAAAVLLGFLWVVWCLVKVLRTEGYGSRRGALVAEKKKL